MNMLFDAASICVKPEKRAAVLKPSPPSLLGGEAWVRGQRLALRKCLVSASRRPLTPPLSPIEETMGERETSRVAA